MLPHPLDEFCRSRCACRGRSACKLAEYPKFQDSEFHSALMWKILVNEDELEAIRQPFLDILDEWMAFETNLPESCQRVLGEFGESNQPLPPTEDEMRKLKERLDAMRREKGLPPTSE